MQLCADCKIKGTFQTPAHKRILDAFFKAAANLMTDPSAIVERSHCLQRDGNYSDHEFSDEGDNPYSVDDDFYDYDELDDNYDSDCGGVDYGDDLRYCD
ncbi:hypothetical protein H9P43_008248 [Blastocladiella emersonii ATCC 22665]|nr:hypothetical protein H9P43_008248 [Blastocladiella emersonii ATCC 22665]